MICQLMTILDKKQRLQMLGMMIVILIGTVFELLGVSAMLPFIQALLNPEELVKQRYISVIFKAFNISETGNIVSKVGVGIIVIYLIKNLYLSISSYLQVAYGNNIKRQLSVLMLKSYMNRPYSFCGKWQRGYSSRCG